MPVTSIENLSHPRRQISGQWRGHAKYIFDDGRSQIKRVVGTTEAEWTQKRDSLKDQVEESQSMRDAYDDTSEDSAPRPIKQAKDSHAVRAYFMRAIREEDPARALRLYQRVAAFRTAKGWTAVQLRNRITTDDFTTDEYRDEKARLDELVDKETEITAAKGIYRKWSQAE